jgi:hypothetical protein
MLKHFCQVFVRSTQAVLAVVFAGVMVLAGVLSQPSQALASSKAPAPEQLSLVTTEAAQDFVESILDDYADVLGDAFDAAIDPIKSSVKTLNKQISKSAKATPAGGEMALPAEVTASQEALQTSVASLGALTEVVEAFKQALADAPAAIETALSTQLDAKLAPLDEAFSEIQNVAALLAADAESLSTDPATGMASLTEHSTLLTQAIDAADVAIDSFGD